jgi:alginate O-acetyltransferase complex protein AlgI
MLFNSLFFIFVFLPVVLVGYYFLVAVYRLSAVWWLIGSSLIFYGTWNPPFVILLIGSITFNRLCGQAIVAIRSRPFVQNCALSAGISANIGLLFYYKYLFPLLSFLNSMSLLDISVSNVVLPLGISFFTFTQISYLIDCRQEKYANDSLTKYVYYVAFFPHLVAGPILRYREILPQLADEENFRFRAENLSVGFTLFAIGLVKKVLLADNIALAADAGFLHPNELTLFSAWGTIISFSLQIYFDFSGYSDMAIGLARMFGIRFPANFSSPYKSMSIVEYWQHWHMTLTRFVTLYIYNPIALSVVRRRARKGLAILRQYNITPSAFACTVALPSFFAMALIGYWHGAGLQFLIFGLLHGFYLSVNHAWRAGKARRNRSTPRKQASLINSIGCVLLTYVAVLVALVFFRADSVRAAQTVLGGMIGMHGVTIRLPLPRLVVSALGPLGALLVDHGFVVADYLALKTIVLVGALLGIIWVMPNSQQMLANFSPVLDHVTVPRFRFMRWQPSIAWGFAIGLAFAWAVGSLNNPAQFIYFQF